MIEENIAHAIVEDLIHLLDLVQAVMLVFLHQGRGHRHPEEIQDRQLRLMSQEN